MDNIMMRFLLSIAQSVSQSITQAVANAPQSAVQMDTTQKLDQALKIMGLGMLGIFFIVGVIILLTWTLQKLFPAKEEE